MAFNRSIRILIPIFLICVFFVDSQAQKKIDSLKQILNSKNTQEKYAIYKQLSFEYALIDPNEASKYADEAVKAALQSNDESKIAEAYQIAGNCKSRNGNYPAALKNLNLASDTYKKLNDEKMVAYVNNDIAFVNFSLKRYDIALSIYTQLLAYYYNKNMVNKYCSILNNIGTLLTEKGEYGKALEKYLKILEIYPKVNPNDKGYMAVLYCNLGEAYYGLKDYGLSYKYRKMSLDLFKENKNTDGIANLLMDAGTSLIKLKDFGTAQRYLKEALTNYKSIKYSEGIRNTKEKIVLLYQETGQYDLALSLCRELEWLSKDSKDSTMLTRCYNMYAEINFAKDNYKAAAEYFRKFIALKDLMDSKENKQKMIELETVFETEEKDFENKTLRQENELQKEKLNSKENILIVVSAGIIFALILLFVLFRKEKRIRKINAEIRIKNLKLEEHIISKDKFFSILAHNLKNPFWAILAQNKMLEESYIDLSDEERKELISSIGSSATNVYKLFEDLLRWAKSQQNGAEFEMQSIKITELMESSIKPYELIARDKKVTLELKYNGELEIKADKFMLETIIGNLIDNAIKFSNQNGKIIVTNREVGDKVEISIQDFGIGMTQEKIDRLFKIGENVSSAGTMNEKGSGLGLIICREFVEKHKGEISVISRENEGTTFKIILPNN